MFTGELIRAAATAGLVLVVPVAAVAGDFDPRAQFTARCGFCHKEGGLKAGKGPKLVGIDKPDEFILNRIRKGKKGRMPGFARVFDDEQLEQMLAYIRQLDDAGG